MSIPEVFSISGSGGMTFTSITTTYKKNVSSCFEAAVGKKNNHSKEIPLFMIQSRIVVLSTLICQSIKCFSLSVLN